MWSTSFTYFRFGGRRSESRRAYRNEWWPRSLFARWTLILIICFTVGSATAASNRFTPRGSAKHVQSAPKGRQQVDLNAALEKQREVIEADTTSISEYKDAIDRERSVLDEYALGVDKTAKALAEYRTLIEKTSPSASDKSNESILEIVANGGLAVAAIFFGFFGVLVGLIPGIDVSVARGQEDTENFSRRGRWNGRWRSGFTGRECSCYGQSSDWLGNSRMLELGSWHCRSGLDGGTSRLSRDRDVAAYLDALRRDLEGNG
jgi:hypothetical protein